MQLNKEKNNSHLNEQRLAQFVAQNFNKKKYTGRKIIYWEYLWIKHRVIPNTKAGNKRRDLSWMENRDLVLSIKD